jgi:hypothetical protein
VYDEYLLHSWFQLRCSEEALLNVKSTRQARIRWPPGHESGQVITVIRDFPQSLTLRNYSQNTALTSRGASVFTELDVYLPLCLSVNKSPSTIQLSHLYVWPSYVRRTWTEAVTHKVWKHPLQLTPAKSVARDQDDRRLDRMLQYTVSTVIYRSRYAETVFGYSWLLMDLPFIGEVPPLVLITIWMIIMLRVTRLFTTSETLVSYHNTKWCQNSEKLDFNLHHEDRRSMDLRNVGILPQHYTGSKPWSRPEIFKVEIFWVVTPSSGWRWRQRGPLKRWYPTTTLDGVTTQKSSTSDCYFTNKF